MGLLDRLFGPRKVEVHIKVEISGSIDLHGPTQNTTYKQHELSSISAAEGTKREQQSESKKAEPTITADFFANESAPPVDFGEEVQ